MILSIFVPGTQPFTDLSATGLGVLFLRHGREAELEADRLGVDYGSGAGYDPAGVPRFLATLARVSALSERGMPNWLSTHPDPGLRVTQAEPVAGKFVSADAKKVNHDQYLERIQGLVFGDNPKDGIVRGNEFLHPLLRIGVKFPDGWELTNTPDAVMAQEPGTQHFMVLQQVEQPLARATAARRATIADIAIEAMRKRATPPSTARCRRSTATMRYVGLYRGNAKGAGKVMMRAAHIAVGRAALRRGRLRAGSRVHARRSRHPAGAADVPPALDAGSVERPSEPLDFYVVRQGDSWQSIAARQSKGFVNAATLAIMNDREVSVQPQPEIASRSSSKGKIGG
jgi:hypothetical protein